MTGRRLFDEYTLKARIVPAIVVMFPYLYLIHSSEMTAPALVNSLLINGIILFIMASVGNELGEAKQRRLYAAWGGKPTTVLLRHRDNGLPESLKQKYHGALQHFSGYSMPSAAYESSHPVEADQMYDTAVKWLLENTRDPQKYYVLGQEYISYGFWRNMLALKNMGIGIAVLTLLIMAGAFMLAQVGWYRFDVRMLLTPLACLAALWFWVRYVKADAVRNAAYGYAKTLLSQCDRLA